jgi:hypothetical protein
MCTELKLLQETWGERTPSQDEMLSLQQNGAPNGMLNFGNISYLFWMTRRSRNPNVQNQVHGRQQMLLWENEEILRHHAWLAKSRIMRRLRSKKAQ